jgi:excisionase family DNA binding protein
MAKDEETKARNMTPAEAGVYVGVPEATLRQWRWRGEGPPYIKVGGRVQYDKDDLDKWMRSRRVVPEFTREVA